MHALTNSAYTKLFPHALLLQNYFKTTSSWIDGSQFNAMCHSGPAEHHSQVLQQVFCCQTPGDSYKISLGGQSHV